MFKEDDEDDITGYDDRTNHAIGINKGITEQMEQEKKEDEVKRDLSVVTILCT